MLTAKLSDFCETIAGDGTALLLPQPLREACALVDDRLRGALAASTDSRAVVLPFAVSRDTT